MKIVIDIPDEDYKFIKDLQFYSSGRRSGKTIERNVINAIKKGTPIKTVTNAEEAEAYPINQKETDNLCDDCKLADDCTASLKGLTGCKTTKCFRREWADKEEENEDSN